MNEKFWQYAELSVNGYTQEQKRQFVQTSISGMLELAAVYLQNLAAIWATSTGNTNIAISYDEIFESWVEVSYDLDASWTLRHNPPRR